MKCVISGVETKNKWRNLPISPEFLEMAKEMMVEDATKCLEQGVTSTLTMRRALSKIEDVWLAEKAKAAIHNG
jgi:hypothetical protein